MTTDLTVARREDSPARVNEASRAASSGRYTVTRFENKLRASIPHPPNHLPPYPLPDKPFPHRAPSIIEAEGELR
jgi:hypothetical protein